MITETPAPFPFGHGSTTLTSRRGREITIRHIRPNDDALLVDLFHHLSEQTRRLRFFSPLPDLPDTIVWREAKRLADIDPVHAAALIATINNSDSHSDREQAIGVARLAVDPHDESIAEPAIVLRDDYQGEGIGSVLFDILVQVAMVRGLKRLRALSLYENAAVNRLIHKLGLPVETHTSHGEMTSLIMIGD
jgi:acetyltransferase